MLVSILVLMSEVPAGQVDDPNPNSIDKMEIISGDTLGPNICLTIHDFRQFSNCVREQSTLCVTNYANYPEPKRRSLIEIDVEGGTVRQMAFLLECEFHWKVVYPISWADLRIQETSWSGEFMQLSRQTWRTVDGRGFVIRPNLRRKNFVFKFESDSRTSSQLKWPPN